MRSRIQIITWTRIRIQLFILMRVQIRIRILPFKLIRICIRIHKTSYNYGFLCVQDVYRCCEVMDVCETGKVYAVMKSKTNVGK